MTVKELKELIDSIDNSYNDYIVITDDPEYNEYCLGSGDMKVRNVNIDIATWTKELYISLTGR